MKQTKMLFVTDMDGTLLGADSRVSARSAAIISELSRQGAMITVATARTPGTVEPLLAHTLTTPPAVVMTGAAMWSRQEHRYHHAHLLESRRAEQVCLALRRHGMEPMVYQLGDDGILLMHCDEGGGRYDQARRFITDRNSLTLKKIHECPEPEAMISGGRNILILSAAPMEVTQRAVADVEAIGGLSVSVYSDPVYAGAGFIEVFTEGVSKARGIQELKEATGAEHVTVFGDNLNDLPMMAVADTSVAVANALPEVKAAADIVIGPNTDDSVATYIYNKLRQE